jgi:hypothetical protein
VSEIVTKVFNSVMASQAVNSEIKHVTRNESGVYLVVARGAAVLVETGENLGMAIVATEGGPIAFSLVSVQHKPKRSMREIGFP